MSSAFSCLPLIQAYAADKDRTQEPLNPQFAFYRKYTEGILRRYVRLSMEAGRVPSLLGQEMFRGRVTSYKVRGFDDVVIFVHDVEQCLKKLTQLQQDLLERIAMQEYTQGEAAALLGSACERLLGATPMRWIDLQESFWSRASLSRLSSVNSLLVCRSSKCSK